MAVCTLQIRHPKQQASGIMTLIIFYYLLFFFHLSLPLFSPLGCWHFSPTNSDPPLFIYHSYLIGKLWACWNAREVKEKEGLVVFSLEFGSGHNIVPRAGMIGQPPRHKPRLCERAVWLLQCFQQTKAGLWELGTHTTQSQVLLVGPVWIIPGCHTINLS